MSYGMRAIGEVTGGRFLQLREDAVIEHLLLDSRRLIFPDTTLFFSLKGPRRDGSAFLTELYKRGVRNFVVQGAAADAGRDGHAGLTAADDSLRDGDRGKPAGSGGFDGAAKAADAFAAMPDANIIVVDDTLQALQQLAAHHRREYTLPVIGITGSNGKTIVKEWLNQLLEDDYHIVRSPKSYNSQTGVPLSVWPLNGSHELAIFEAGISLPGEMQRLEEIIRPTIGIFTNIGEPHSEGFDSLAAKAAEKLKLFRRAGLLIYNNDQVETARAIGVWMRFLGEEPAGPGGTTARAAGAAPQLFSWGRTQGSTLRVVSTGKHEGITTIVAQYAGNEYTLPVPFTDEASIENALHCICVLLYLGGSAERIRARLVKLSPLAMRLELKSGINHCSIINDSYSADLSSLTIALDFLSQQQQHARRTVILSDFLESGLEEEKLYTTIALALAQKNIDRLVGVGPRIGAHQAVFGQWFPGETVFYPSVEAITADLYRLHFRDETILLKGARVFAFEEIDRMLSEQIHQTVLEIDLNAMAANLRSYRQLLQPATRVMAMVKAFAYGSGSFEIANLLQFHGVDYLGVAYADEGVSLRKAGIRMPIMVMNTENSSFDLLVLYNLEPVIYSFPLLQSFDRWLKKEGLLQFPVHVELETGMNRLGFPVGELEELGQSLLQSAFKVQSIFSHLAASEEAQQDDYTARQGDLYLAAIARLQELLPYSFLRHISNSAAIIRHPRLQLDMVRLGIGLYGIDSANSQIPELQEVSTLKTTIAQIKYLKEGETVGYNRRGIAGPGTVIATVRIGYADGYPRRLGNGVGKMWLRGRLAPVIGSVCMDMTMIDITGIPGITEGDEVVVFGNELSVNQLAHWAGTIPYEILTGVSQRVRRVYFEE